MNPLVEAFAKFFEHLHGLLSTKLRTGPTAKGVRSVLRVLPPAAPQVFEEAEEHETWRALTKVCADTFSKEGHSKSTSSWSFRLGRWLRRKGPYLRALEGERLDADVVASDLVADLRASEHQSTLLALVEGAEFTKECLDFGSFQVVRLSSKELDALFGFRANATFYPHAITSPTRLCDHWYIRVTRARPPRKIGKWVLGHDEGPVQPGYTWIDPDLEKALKLLVAWDWWPDHSDRPSDELAGDQAWEPFSIPFVLEASNDPFRYPRPAPPIHQLQYRLKSTEFSDE